MLYSVLLVATGLTSVLAVPAPQADGSLGLGEQCSSSAECANGANCYSTNSGLITVCGNFQASCSSDSQCAYNTCNNGLCNGFIPLSNTTTSSTPATGAPTLVYLPLGADCNPNSTPCANGSSCYATNSMLQPRCGNFQANCANDSQCAFNTCRDGFCNGFLAPRTTSSTQSGGPSTATMASLPLGADCSPDSTPCANGAQCYATNSMLQPRCGNFQSACTSDAQCAFNTCRDGLCNGFLAGNGNGNGTGSSAAGTPGPIPYPTASNVTPVTPAGTGGAGPSATRGPTSSATVQVNSNAASASRSGPVGFCVAGGLLAMLLLA